MSIIRDFKWGIVCFSTISDSWIIPSNAWKSLLRFCYYVIAIGHICIFIQMIILTHIGPPITTCYINWLPNHKKEQCYLSCTFITMWNMLHWNYQHSRMKTIFLSYLQYLFLLACGIQNILFASTYICTLYTK